MLGTNVGSLLIFRNEIIAIYLLLFLFYNIYLPPTYNENTTKLLNQSLDLLT